MFLAAINTTHQPMDRYYFDHGHVSSLNVLFRPGFIVLGTVLMRCVSVVSPVKRFTRSAITIYRSSKIKNKKTGLMIVVQKPFDRISR